MMGYRHILEVERRLMEIGDDPGKCDYTIPNIGGMGFLPS